MCHLEVSSWFTSRLGQVGALRQATGLRFKHLHMWIVKTPLHLQHLSFACPVSAAHVGGIILVPAVSLICQPTHRMAATGRLSCSSCWWQPASCWLGFDHLWGRHSPLPVQIPRPACYMLLAMAQIELHGPGVPTCSSHAAPSHLQALLQLLVAACLMLLVVGQVGDLPPEQARSPNPAYKTGEHEPYAPSNVAVTISHGISFQQDPSAGELCTLLYKQCLSLPVVRAWRLGLLVVVVWHLKEQPHCFFKIFVTVKNSGAGALCPVLLSAPMTTTMSGVISLIQDSHCTVPPLFNACCCCCRRLSKLESDSRVEMSIVSQQD